MEGKEWSLGLGLKHRSTLVRKHQQEEAEWPQGDVFGGYRGAQRTLEGLGFGGVQGTHIREACILTKIPRSRKGPLRMGESALLN